MSDASSHLPPILRRLHLLRGSAGVSSGRVIDYILQGPERFLGLTIAEISDRTQTSDATVVRLVQAMGFSGFQEFKLQLSRSLALSRNTDLTVEAGDPGVAVLRKVFDAASVALSDTLEHLDLEAFSSAVQAIALSRHVVLVGLGSSGLVALDGQHRALGLGLSCGAYADPGTFLTVCSLLEPTDVLIAVSYSGASPDILRAAKLARQVGATVIALTGLGRSSLSRLAHHTLTSSAPGGVYRPESLAARLPQLCVLDALLTSLHVSQEPYMSERLARAKAARRTVSSGPQL